MIRSSTLALASFAAALALAPTPILAADQQRASTVPGRRATAIGAEGGTSVGATRLYPWSEGSTYRLHAAPERISDVALQPGENLVSVAAGDTTRWIIGDTSSGTGQARRIHVLVKPVASGLRTNLLIATDRRLYHVELSSRSGTTASSMAWTYPQDSLIALEGRPVSGAMAGPAVALESLYFRYRIEGDKTDWRPVRAFDDGHRTFIEFPATIASGEAPPLFVAGSQGQVELVNYRVKGRFYIIDRLFAAAELRLGGKRQKVVRIIRDDGRVPRRPA